MLRPVDPPRACCLLNVDFWVNLCLDDTLLETPSRTLRGPLVTINVLIATLLKTAVNMGYLSVLPLIAFVLTMLPSLERPLVRPCFMVCGPTLRVTGVACPCSWFEVFQDMLFHGRLMPFPSCSWHSCRWCCCHNTLWRRCLWYDLGGQFAHFAPDHPESRSIIWGCCCRFCPSPSYHFR